MRKLLLFVFSIFSLLSSAAYAITPDDISIMRRSGVQIKENESDRDFTSIRPGITVPEFSTIYGISFSGINLSVVPSFIYDLNNLRELDLSNSSVSLEGLSGIIVLDNLERLDISENHFQYIDGGPYLSQIINDLPSLKILDITGLHSFHIDEWCGAHSVRASREVRSLTNVNLQVFRVSGPAMSAFYHCSSDFRHMNLSRLEISHDDFSIRRWRVENVNPTRYQVRICDYFNTEHLRELDLGYESPSPAFRAVWLDYCPMPNLETIDIQGLNWDRIDPRYDGIFSLPRLVRVTYDTGQEDLPAVIRFICSHLPEDGICVNQ